MLATDPKGPFADVPTDCGGRSLHEWVALECGVSVRGSALV